MKLSRMPSVEIIRKYAGIVDFSCCRGIYYARKWPKKFKVTAPGTLRGNTKFKTCVANYNLLSEAEKMYWRTQAYGKGISGRDAFMSDCLKNS